MSAIAERHSVPQCLRALERGNMIRSHRAKVKRDLKAGLASFRDVLADPLFGSMRVFDAVQIVPRVGMVAASRTLDELGISRSLTCSGLSPARQDELVEHLGFRVAV